MSTKQKFSYNTSDLTEFVQEQGLELLTKTFFGGATAQLMNSQIQAGNKGKKKINFMSTDLHMRAVEGCGSLSASGSVDFTQKEIEVKTIGDVKTFCPKDLELFYTNKYYNQVLTTLKCH